MIDARDSGAPALAAVDPRVDVLYRDDHVLVVAKPPGLIVHRGWANDRVVVMTLVRDAIGAWVYPVHRLDRGTSGALVFALDPDSQRVLSQDFEAQRVQKRYLTLVRGRLTEGGTLDYAIPKSEKGERVPAVTEYRPLLVLDRFTLVEAVPKTGRLRQIRRHMKHLGHPIVLDKRHGRGEFHGLAAERYGFTRMVLHSREVGFDHPVTRRHIRVVAPLQDLHEPFQRLGATEAVLGDSPGVVVSD